MATVYVNASTIGGVTAGGKQATIISRAAAAGGAVTLAYDTTKITSRGQLRQLVADMLPTLLDLLPIREASLATIFLSTINGVPPYGPASSVGVTQGTSTVAAAAINVELNTTICPLLSTSDALRQLEAIMNYIRTNKATLGLIIP